jgi:ketol-acid reductoisomerase
MDYMYNARTTTARRGALDWAPIFGAANRPIFEKLSQSVRDGTETRKAALEFNGRNTYRKDFARELKEIDDQEIWQAGKTDALVVPGLQALSSGMGEKCFRTQAGRDGRRKVLIKYTY